MAGRLFCSNPIMRVVILGAGFGGLELSSLISEQFGSDPESGVEVVLIDKAEGFVFGFSKLELMFNGARSPKCCTRTPGW